MAKVDGVTGATTSQAAACTGEAISVELQADVRVVGGDTQGRTHGTAAAVVQRTALELGRLGQRNLT